MKYYANYSKKFSKSLIIIITLLVWCLIMLPIKLFVLNLNWAEIISSVFGIAILTTLALYAKSYQLKNGYVVIFELFQIPMKRYINIAEIKQCSIIIKNTMFNIDSYDSVRIITSANEKIDLPIKQSRDFVNELTKTNEHIIVI